MSPDLPIGGSTGHCHESSSTIDIAAQWLVAQGDMTGRAIVPELKQRFGLTALECCQVCAAAGTIKARAPR